MSFSFPNSLSNLKDFISKTDDDGSLQIYSYNYCDNNSSEDLKKCRGLVFNGDNLLFNSLGFTPEYSEYDNELLSKNPIENYKFFPSEEGTLIRLFYYNKWYVSTHRKLDAFNSRWGSQKSFGEIFVDSVKTVGYDSLESLTSKLDKKSMYLFFIRNTLQNKIVSEPPTEHKVYFVGVSSPEFGVSMSCENFDFPTQQKLNFENWEQVFDYVKQVNPKEKQGVLAFYNDNSGKLSQFKIVNSTYQLLSQVRGNEPNLTLRYLQVRSHHLYKKMVYDLYPEHLNYFINIENIIIKICKNIHNAYVSRFVGKNYTVVSQEEYVIIKECHGWHIQDRKNNKVTLSQVIGFINKEKYTNLLYTLVNRFISSNK